MTKQMAAPRGRPREFGYIFEVRLDAETKGWVELMARHFAISEAAFVRIALAALRDRPEGIRHTSAARRETHDDTR